MRMRFVRGLLSHVPDALFCGMTGVTTRLGVIIYVFSALLAGAISVTSPHTVPVFHEAQWYAGLALALLYLALLIRPLYLTFPRLPYESAALRSQQALGISSFSFALAHSYFGFFGFVGGFRGLRYWSGYFAWSLFCGLLALCLLAVATISSIPYLMRHTGPCRKLLHRSTYVAGLLILIHGVTVTIHLVHLRAILMVTYPLVLFLLVLEILRFDCYVTDRYRALPKRMVTLICFPLVSILLFWSLFFLDHHAH